MMLPVWLAAVQRVHVRLDSGPSATPQSHSSLEVARIVLETIGTDESASLLVLCRLQENVLESRVVLAGEACRSPSELMQPFLTHMELPGCY